MSAIPMQAHSSRASKKPTRNTLTLSLLICALLLPICASCSTPSSPSPKPDPYAVPSTNTNLDALPPKQQFLRARKVHRRAQRALNDGYPKRALPLYTQALAVYERLNDFSSQASIHNDLSLIYQNARRLPEAQTALERAIALSSKGDVPLVTLEARYNLARVLVAQKLDPKALPVYNQTLQDAASLKNLEIHAMALNGRGNLHRRQGEFDKSLHDHTVSIQDWQRLKRPDMISHTWMNIGYTKTLQGAYDEAKDAFQEATRILASSQSDNAPSVKRRRSSLLPHLRDMIRRLNTDPTKARDYVLSITQPVSSSSSRK